MVLLTTLTARPARADVYSDLTAIIEQLVEDNLSTQVIPNAAAKVPALCTYFPATIGAIQQKRYVGLDLVFRKEIADLIGYKVYLEVLSEVPKADQPVKAQLDAAIQANFEDLSRRGRLGRIGRDQFTSAAAAVTTLVPQPTPPSSASSSPTPATTSCLGPVGGQASFAGLTSIATVQMSTCATVQQDKVQELACAAGVTVRDVVVGAGSMLAPDLTRLQAALTAEVLAHTPTLTQAQLQAIVQSFATILTRLGVPNSVSSDVAIAAIIALGEACNANDRCKKLASWIVTSGVSSGVAEIIGDLQRHDYGSAAGTVIDLAQALTCGEKCPDQKVLAFVRALAVYVVDSATSGQSTGTADENFRAAAVDLIEGYGGLGYERKTWTVGSLVYPTFSLRESLRPGHVNADDGTLTRYVSIDLLTLRHPWRFTQSIYVAPQLSLVDLAGPLSDRATTGHMLDGAPNSDWAALAAFFVPRASVEIGIPGLSRNLLIGASVAFRLYAEEPTGASSAVYCFVGQACSAAGMRSTSLYDYFEFGVHVSFIP